jgi:hypothetical protein
MNMVFYEENKCRSNSGNLRCLSFHNILSSLLLSKNITIKTQRTLIFPVGLNGCETLSLTVSEEHRLRVFEKRVPLVYLDIKENDRRMEKIVFMRSSQISTCY